MPTSLLKNKKSQQGQTLLIMVLVMAVGLTVGLSTISRTVTDVKVSEQTDEAVRAFSAAEAGIEQALTGNLTPDTFYNATTGDTLANYNASSVALTPSSTVNFPPIEKDQVQTLWLTDPNNYKSSKAFSGQRLMVYWGNPTDEAALEVSIYYTDGASYKVARFPFEPRNSRADGNPAPSCNNTNCFCNLKMANFCTDAAVEYFRPTDPAIDSPIDGISYRYVASINLGTAGIRYIAGSRWPIFARVRTFYVSNSQVIGFAGDANFPSQGTKIASTGQSGDSTRRVEVIRYHAAPPEIFDFVLYSGGNISKP